MSFVSLGGDGLRPTFFELVAAERLVPSLKAAITYSLAVRQFAAGCSLVSFVRVCPAQLPLAYAPPTHSAPACPPRPSCRSMPSAVRGSTACWTTKTSCSSSSACCWTGRPYAPATRLLQRASMA